MDEVEESKRNSALARFGLSVLVLTFVIVAGAFRLGGHDSLIGGRIYASSVSKTGNKWPIDVQVIEAEGELLRSQALSQVRVDTNGQVLFEGPTNTEGLIRIDIPYVDRNRAIPIRITTKTKQVLAQGPLQPPPPINVPRIEPQHQAFSRREGDVDIDVFVVGGRIALQQESIVLVEVRDKSGQRAARTKIDVTLGGARLVSDPSLASSFFPHVVRLVAEAHIIEAKFHVAASRLLPNDDPSSTNNSSRPLDLHGEWTGTLQTAPGSGHLSSENSFAWDNLRPTEEGDVDVSFYAAPKVAYIDVWDEMGRVHAASLALADRPSGVGAKWKVPALDVGAYWVVLSRTAQDANLPSTRAWPFLVESPDGPKPVHAGDLWKLQMTPPPLTLILDGYEQTVARAHRRRDFARAIAVTALLIGGLTEIFLLAVAFRRSSSIKGPVGAARSTRILSFLALAALIALGFFLLAGVIIQNG